MIGGKEYLEIEKLYELVSAQNFKEKAKGNTKFYLIQEKDNDGVTLFDLDVENKTQKKLLDIFISYFKGKSIHSKSQLVYDVVMAHAGNENLVVAQSKDYDGIKEFIELFQDTTPPNSIKGQEMDSFIAYAVCVSVPNEVNFTFVGEFSGLSKVSKMKIVGNLTDEKFKELDAETTYGFSKNIAMVIYGDEVLIKNINIFEKCCSMKTVFKTNARTVLNDIKSYDFIDNIDELITASDSDQRIARRLTKMNSDPDRVKAFFTNSSRVTEVLEDSAFKNKFQGIVYNGKTLKFESKYRQQFITLISDAAYQSIVGGQKRLDNSL